MENDLILQCPNCGHTWSQNERPKGGAQQPAGAVCPVCQFRLALTAPAAVPALSVDELESQLSTLIDEARASGVASDAIVDILRDELAFALELAHPGRRMYIQIIDLGPQEDDALSFPVRDRSVVLRSRSLGLRSRSVGAA
ncbi:MAG TPA: hypothetical protein VNL77_05035 [Roseiflexaceae bacterium]|nr:hypothetical protein [Roseiflexaceae bacterium]